MQKPLDLKDGELIVWAQLAPFGVHPGMRDGEVVRQVCDRLAFERVIAAFKPEVLMDFEHRSENSDDTAAAAWVQELRISAEDGLEGLLRFTADGAQAVRTRRLRYPSPVWPLGDDNRPTYLKSVALTNTPNFDLRPVLNKEPAGADPNPHHKGRSHMKELAALYGLPETATEAEILAAAKAAQEKTAALETRLAELEKATLAQEGEAIAEQNKAKVQNKAKFVELYVQNKAFALALLDTIGAAKPPPVCNKAAARNPADVFGGSAVQNKLAQYDAMPAGREKAAFLRANAVEINALRNAALTA